MILNFINCHEKIKYIYLNKTNKDQKKKMNIFNHLIDRYNNFYIYARVRETDKYETTPLEVLNCPEEQILEYMKHEFYKYALTNDDNNIPLKNKYKCIYLYSYLFRILKIEAVMVDGISKFSHFEITMAPGLFRTWLKASERLSTTRWTYREHTFYNSHFIQKIDNKTGIIKYYPKVV